MISTDVRNRSELKAIGIKRCFFSTGCYHRLNSWIKSCSSQGYKRNPVINVPCFHTNHNELQTPISIKYISLLVSEIGESKVKSIIS